MDKPSLTGNGGAYCMRALTLPRTNSNTALPARVRTALPLLLLVVAPAAPKERPGPRGGVRNPRSARRRAACPARFREGWSRSRRASAADQ